MVWMKLSTDNKTEIIIIKKHRHNPKRQYSSHFHHHDALKPCHNYLEGWKHLHFSKTTLEDIGEVDHYGNHRPQVNLGQEAIILNRIHEGGVKIGSKDMK